MVRYRRDAGELQAGHPNNTGLIGYIVSLKYTVYTGAQNAYMYMYYTCDYKYIITRMHNKE